MTMSAESEKSEMMPEAARADVESFLSRFLVREIDRQFVVQLTESPASELLELLAPGCRAYLTNFDYEAEEDAAVEFCRLFIAPATVPPRSAQWMQDPEGLIAAELTTQSLAELGMESQENLPSDHLGLLLEILASSRRTDRGILVKQVYAHLNQCLPNFAQKWESEAENPLYLACAKLTQQLFCKDYAHS